jgi:Holliday junction DNA helicase RuvA
VIAKLRGTVSDKKPGEVVLDVGGVGYHAHISFNTFCRLPEVGEPALLEIVTNLREGALELFGFASCAEKELFGLLRSVSGIGPRLALAILSGIEAVELREVLRTAAIDRLVAIPGIGRKTAERMLVELKGKVDDARGVEASPDVAKLEADAVLALVALGYKQIDARKAVNACKGDVASGTIEGLIRRSLAYLSAP